MSSLVRSTGIVALSTLCSRILGLVRDVLMAAYFGAGRTADVFFVSFMIPNLFRRLVAEGALTISFIPVYTETLINEGDDEALSLAQKTLTIQAFFVGLIITAGMIFSPELMELFFGRSDTAEVFSLSVNLTRFMFPYLFFASFVAFSLGYLNSRGHFFAPAFAPVLLNVGMITGITVFSRFFDEPVYGVAAGVLAGGVMQLILQLPYMVRHGFKMRVSLDFNHPGIRKIFRMLTPALFGIAVYQINILVNNMLATMLPEGSVSYIYYTNRLTELVLGVFIVSIGSVVLPEMSRLTAVDDSGRFKTLFADSISSALFLAVPASAALIAAGLEVISVMFMRGKFTFADAGLTYYSLIFASVGIVFVSVLRIATPAFYSMKDTKTPVISAAVALVINVTFGYILMQTELKHAGLTLANTISAIVQMLILVTLLHRKTGGLDLMRIFRSFVKFAAASVLMAVVVRLISGFADWSNDPLTIRAAVLALIVVSGSVTYFAVCWLLGSDEISFLIRKLKEKSAR